MKIGLQTWGSDGDIRPIIALAGGLRKSGHEVILAVTSVDKKDYSELAGSLDFKVIHTRKNPDKSLHETAMQIIKTNLPLQQVKILLEEQFGPYQDEMFETAMELAGECDLLIGHHIAGSLKAAAEKTGRDYVSVFLCHSFLPSSRTAPYPLPNLGSYLNPLLWKVAGFLMDISIKKYYNGLRERNGITPIKSILGGAWESEKLNLIAISPLICTHQPDWGDHTRVCGFFDIPLSAEKWHIPPDLQKFLDAGEPPVYFTFGSMTPLSPEDSTPLMQEAANLSGKRAIVQSHWDTVTGSPETNSGIYRMSKAPHHRIFPLCAAVVHHGGAGTTQSAVYSGVPSIVVEHAFDQGFWGNELRRMGVGGNVLNMRTVTPKQLAEAVRVICDSQKIREKSRITGQAMRNENGVNRAVDLIEKYFG